MPDTKRRRPRELHGRIQVGEVFVVLTAVFFLVAVLALMQDATAVEPAADIELGREHVDDLPPQLILDEADGYTFPTGAATLSTSFMRALDGDIIPTVERQSEGCRCDVLEVFGHTDGQPHRGAGGRPRGRLDDLPAIFDAGDLSGLTASSNVELGWLRAAAVADVLRRARRAGRMPEIRVVRFYSAGSMVLPSGEPAPGADVRPDAGRRRIELRLSRSRGERAPRPGPGPTSSRRLRQGRRGAGG